MCCRVSIYEDKTDPRREGTTGSRSRLGLTLTSQVPTNRVLEPLGPYIVGTWEVRVSISLQTIYRRRNLSMCQPDCAVADSRDSKCSNEIGLFYPLRAQQGEKNRARELQSLEFLTEACRLYGLLPDLDPRIPRM